MWTGIVCSVLNRFPVDSICDAVLCHLCQSDLISKEKKKATWRKRTHAHCFVILACHISWQVRYSVILNNMNAFGRCTNCHDFPHKTRLQCEINLVGERAGFGLTGPCSDHGQVMLRSAVHRAWSPVSHSHCVLHLNAWLLFFFLSFCCLAFSTHLASKSLPQTMFPLPSKLAHRPVQFYWYL